MIKTNQTMVRNIKVLPLLCLLVWLWLTPWNRAVAQAEYPQFDQNQDVLKQHLDQMDRQRQRQTRERLRRYIKTTEDIQAVMQENELIRQEIVAYQQFKANPIPSEEQIQISNEVEELAARDLQKQAIEKLKAEKEAHIQRLKNQEAFRIELENNEIRKRLRQYQRDRWKNLPPKRQPPDYTAYNSRFLSTGR